MTNRRVAIGMLLASLIALSGCASTSPATGSDPRSRYLAASCPPAYPVGTAYDAQRSGVSPEVLRNDFTAARKALVISARRLHATTWPASIAGDVAIVEADNLAQAAWFDRAVRSPSIGTDWWSTPPEVELSTNRIRNALHIDSATACELDG